MKDSYEQQLLSAEEQKFKQLLEIAREYDDLSKKCSVNPEEQRIVPFNYKGLDCQYYHDDTRFKNGQVLTIAKKIKDPRLDINSTTNVDGGAIELHYDNNELQFMAFKGYSPYYGKYFALCQLGHYITSVMFSSYNYPQEDIFCCTIEGLDRETQYKIHKLNYLPNGVLEICKESVASLKEKYAGYPDDANKKILQELFPKYLDDLNYIIETIKSSRDLGMGHSESLTLDNR